MRSLGVSLFLLLAPQNLLAEADCFEGMVVLRLHASQTPSTASLASSPPSFGIVSIDQLLAQYDPTEIRPFLVSPSGIAQSAAVDQLQRTYLVYYSDDENPHVVVAELASNPAVEDVHVNKRVTKYYFGTKRIEPTDTQFPNQWNLDNTDDQVDIDAPEAWAIEAGDPNEVIGFIDLGTMVETPSGLAGVFDLHPDNTFFFNDFEDIAPKGTLGPEDLNGDDAADTDHGNWKDNVVGYRFPRIPATITDLIEKRFWTSVPHNWGSSDQKHGVWVASIAAAKAVGGSNIAGVANGCKVYTLRDGVGVDGATGQAEEALAIRLAADFSRVINMSWGFFDDLEEEFLEAIAYAIAKDCVLVAASGNTTEGPPTSDTAWPARHAEVLSVGSISPLLVKDYYSRFGPAVGNVDLMAPVGTGIPVNSHTDCPPDEPGCPQDPMVMQNFDGTSAACPQVAGVAALVRSRFPGLTQGEVRGRLKASSEWYWGATTQDSLMYGSGKVNAYRALSEWGSISGNVTWTKNTLRPYLDQGVWVSRPGSRDGKYYVSGDLTIEDGATLTLTAGTIVRVAPDHEELGADPDRVQIVVKAGGTLNILGSSASQGKVVFESFTDSSPTAGDWIGIKFEAGSSGTIEHAVFKNAARAVENYASIEITNCIFTDCETAIDAHANVTANGTLLANNSVAVDVYAGTTSLTKCTVAQNTGSAAVARGSSNLVISKCVTAFNGGPAVRVISGWTGTATMANSIVFSNIPAPLSATDASWQSNGVNVFNENPAFCDAQNRNYELYAFSPAVKGPHFAERVGALPKGCIPDATVTATALARSCPLGDGPVPLEVEIAFDEAVMTRDIGMSEIVLDHRDIDAKVFNSDSTLQANLAATEYSDYHSLIVHNGFGFYCKNDPADVLLNGFPLEEKALIHVRTADCAAPFGIIDVSDAALFGAHYTSPPKAYNAACDFDDTSTIVLNDFSFLGAHYQHASNSPINAPAHRVSSSASIALQFTEEFLTATTHRLYVDVDVEGFSGVNTSVFSLIAGSDRLTLSSWESADDRLGAVVFSPVFRDGQAHLFFAAFVSDAFTGTSARLGRLVFEVAGNSPFDVTDDLFNLAIGDVLLDATGEGPATAQMNGAVDRVFDPAVARVYHNRLEQNFPNPFNPTTTVAFSLKNASIVSLTIYDVAGRRVRELLNERRERGAYTVVWDGKSDNGSAVSSGVYFYKLVAGSFTDTKKMTYLK